MKKLTWKKLLGIVLVVVVALYVLYMGVPRRLSGLVPNIRQAEQIYIMTHEIEEQGTLTLEGEDINRLIDHLDRFIFFPVRPFSGRSSWQYETYYGKVYDIYAMFSDGTRWRLTVSDQCDMGIKYIFGSAPPFVEGHYIIQADSVQVLPPELEDRMEYEPIN